MSVDRARDALVEMRREVGLSLGANIEEFEAVGHLRNASRWALVFLAESRATEFAWQAAERQHGTTT